MQSPGCVAQRIAARCCHRSLHQQIRMMTPSSADSANIMIDISATGPEFAADPERPPGRCLGINRADQQN
jgi:hypothetical protein